MDSSFRGNDDGHDGADLDPQILLRSLREKGASGSPRYSGIRGRESAGVDVMERAVLEERERIAQLLRDRMTEIFGEPAEATVSDGKKSSPAAAVRRHGLDETDLAILRLVTKGASNQEIGREVHLSPAAVKDHIGRLMRRLGARRRAELSAPALRAGIA